MGEGITPGIGRRHLLRAGLATAATVGLAACSGDLSGTRPITVDRPAFTFGEVRREGSMSKPLLVAYATRTGSTVGVASAIGETLGKHGYSVDVKPIADNPRLDGYNAVVIGSAINGGKWLPEAEQFVKTNQQALGGIPTALFCVHIMNLGDDERSRQNRLAYLNEIRPLVKPVDEAWFAGLGPESAPSGIAGWFYRMFGGSDVTGDQRDWAKISGWAESLGTRL